MRLINEKDMQIKEIFPHYKYVEKLYARYPLIGNAVLSESNLKKVYSQAKQILDKFIEMSAAQSAAPIIWHLFLTLATINYAKNWNSAEESRFTKYITLQFGYRDDTGRIWNVITNSIERALNAKGRFFLRDEGGREFYETVLIHSFAPESSWNPVFDLLYDFLRINLRWNYVKEDPIVDKMVYVLADRINGLSSDDDDIIISTGEYRIRLGAKRLLQNRPEYTVVLFDSILSRIDGLLHNRASEPKCYVDYLVDDWFSKKIACMLEGDKRQLGRSAHSIMETAISYSRIRATVSLNEGRLLVHIPAIRLEDTGHRIAEVNVFESDRIVGETIPEIYGNELGETITECNLLISLSADSKCNLRVEVICDSTVIYDSNKQLYRKLLVFKKNKECSLNSLKPGTYEMYIPGISKYEFENADILEQSGKYIKVNLLEDFAIKQEGKILAMDTSNLQGATIAEPIYKSELYYVLNNEHYEVTESEDSFKIYAGSKTDGKYIRLFVDDQDVNIDKFWDENAKLYEVFLSDIIQPRQVASVTIINLESDIVLYKKAFMTISNVEARFNREFYLFPGDYADASVNVTIEEKEFTLPVTETDSVIEIEFGDGSFILDVPSVKYEWKNVEKMFLGDCIWKDDISEDSRLIIYPAANVETFIELGNNRINGNEINLYKIVKEEGERASYNYQIILYVNGTQYKLGQIIFSEMFTKMPFFSLEEKELLWDGGVSYIGNDNDSLLLQLFTDEDLQYELNMRIGENRIALPNDFIDGEYTYSIVKNKSGNELILAQDTQFFGNPNKTRFLNQTIYIDEVTEDTGEGSRPQRIKPVYIENIEFVKKGYVPSEDGIFDIYTGQMYFVRMDGSKKYYSNKYYNWKTDLFYKVNPVQIIYINDGILRIVNGDNEGLYWYDNYGSSPRLEITDREPPIGAKNYKDILFYLYGTKRQTTRRESIPFRNSIISEPYRQNENSIFDRFVIVPQNEVVEADVPERMLINAGPGTGKTWTLIERIIFFVNEKGVDPETILVLCFSKAAVEVIRGRLVQAVQQQRVSEIVNRVDVRTFDSFASQVLYWIKNESEYDNLQFYDIGKLNYDSRISLFNSVITEIPEVVSQCAHLIVDEVQDLVKDRARMVIELIRSMPENGGVTLLGDSCQSIYDYQVGNNENMTSAQFYKVMVERTKGFSYLSFNRNYRQGEQFSELGDNYRKRILSGNSKKCDDYWEKVISKKILKFEVYEAKKLDGNVLARWLEKGTVGILTRTNGQALKISSVLRDKGVDHCLRKRLSDNSLNEWIALIFNDYSLSSISEIEFSELYTKIEGAQSESKALEVWGALRDAVRSSSERIGVREILKGLMSCARNTLLYTEENNSRLTVTSIHRGKGREFDTVLVEDDIFTENEKNIEEHKVCYVAVTRPKDEIYRIDAKVEYMRIDKEGDRRCYKADFVAYNKQRLTFFEVGLERDVDLKSFCREDGVQEFIRDNHHRLRGMSVMLIKHNRSSSYVRYKIVLEETGQTMGYTSQQFCESLDRALRTVYHLPQKAQLYFNVYPDRFSDIYVEDVITVVAQSDGSECGTRCYGEMTSWNALNIIGYSRVEYI